MHIVRYLFRHKAALLAVVLLFTLQAAFDLALPRYTSDIVDVGIQQSGIADAVPEALSPERYAALEAALAPTDAATFAASYTRTDAYYEYTGVGGEVREALSRALATPLLTLAGIEPAEEYSMQLQQCAEVIKQDYEALGLDVTDMQVNYLWRTGALMLLMVVLSCLCHLAMNFFATRTSATIARNLRSRLFNAVLNFSQREINEFSAASLITRGTNDIQLVQFSSIMLQRMVTYSVIVAIGGVICVARTNVSMTWTIVLAVIAVIGCMSVLVAITMPKFKLMQKLVDKINLVSRENLTGVSVIRAFNRERFEEERFARASGDLMSTQLFTSRAMSFMQPTLMLIMNGVSVLIVWVGAHYVDLGTIQTGDLIAFITYAMTIISSFLMLGMVALMLPRAEVAATRVDEVINTQSTVLDPAAPRDAEFFASFAGADAGVSVEFDHVSFSYGDRQANGEDEERPGVLARLRERFARGKGGVRGAAGGSREGHALNADADFKADVAAAAAAQGAAQGTTQSTDALIADTPDATENVLEDIHFTINAGETCAIVGGTGAGKSTLIKLMLRFYDVTQGAVRLNGIDVRELSQTTIRKTLALVPQTSYLFEGDLTDNVAYGRGEEDPATQEEAVRRALAIAQADAFVAEKEQGIHTEVAQGGTNFSGGQRQRLTIARALATDARGYLFDDSFSALDYKTDLALRSALAENLSAKTVVIVAQRMSTVLNADKIVVLEEGRVAGVGTHAELFANCAAYREIALSQLSEAELSERGVQ